MASENISIVFVLGGFVEETRGRERSAEVPGQFSSDSFRQVSFYSITMLDIYMKELRIIGSLHNPLNFSKVIALTTNMADKYVTNN